MVVVGVVLVVVVGVVLVVVVVGVVVRAVVVVVVVGVVGLVVVLWVVGLTVCPSLGTRNIKAQHSTFANYCFTRALHDKTG